MFYFVLTLVVIFILIVCILVYQQSRSKMMTTENFALSKTGEGAFCKRDGIALADMNIYLINLAKNNDRLESFIEQYMMSDLRYKQFVRFDAIYGNNIDVEDYVTPLAYKEITAAEKTGFRTKHYQLTRGAVGCYLSHQGVLELAANGDRNYALIFEDDVSIDRHILAKMNRMITAIPDNWDILLLGCWCIVCDKYDKYYDTERFFLLHAYVIKKPSAIKILKHLKSKRIEQQIDSELSDMISAGICKIYCLKDAIAKQGNGFQTNIQMPIKVVPGANPFQAVHV